MLTIGEFSRICSVTKKTLRYYDEIGLLRPEYIAENGYRYYTSGQLRTMLFITRLKTYGFSLLEIAAVLVNTDELFLAEKLMEKRSLLETEMRATQRILQRLDEDVEKLKRSMDIMEHNYHIETIELPETQIYSVRKKINIQNYSELMGELFTSIMKNKVQPVGPPISIYHDEDFDPDDADIEVAVPVAQDGEGTRMLCGGLHAFARLLGPYDKAAFTGAYAALMQWVDENGYHLYAPPYEKYVKGGPDEPPEENITEIFFPIVR